MSVQKPKLTPTHTWHWWTDKPNTNVFLFIFMYSVASSHNWRYLQGSLNVIYFSWWLRGQVYLSCTTCLVKIKYKGEMKFSWIRDWWAQKTEIIYMRTSLCHLLGKIVLKLQNPWRYCDQQEFKNNRELFTQGIKFSIT